MIKTNIDDAVCIAKYRNKFFPDLCLQSVHIAISIAYNLQFMAVLRTVNSY